MVQHRLIIIHNNLKGNLILFSQIPLLETTRIQSEGGKIWILEDGFMWRKCPIKGEEIEGFRGVMSGGWNEKQLFED
jgi:hypothetical protein